jgi:drug/metabolite transporter (DMT)-like permease
MPCSSPTRRVLRREHTLWRWKTLTDHGPEDWVALLASCVVGVAIGWSAYNVQQRVTATTMFVLTNSNKILVIAFGMVFMGDPASMHAVIGTTLALGGGIAYGVAGMRLKRLQEVSKGSTKARSEEDQEEDQEEGQEEGQDLLHAPGRKL